jgi:hypothetical protein
MVIQLKKIQNLKNESNYDNIIHDSYTNFFNSIKSLAYNFNIKFNEECSNNSLDEILENCMNIENNIYSHLLKTKNKKLVLDYQKNIIRQKLKNVDLDEYINLKDEEMNYHNIRYSKLKKIFPFLYTKIKKNKSLTTIFYESINEYNKKYHNSFNLKLPNWFKKFYVKIINFIDEKEDNSFKTKDLREYFNNELSDYLLYEGINAAIDRGLIKRVSQGNYQIIHKLKEDSNKIITKVNKKEIIIEKKIEKKSFFGKKKESTEKIIKKEVIFKKNTNLVHQLLLKLDDYKSTISNIYLMKLNNTIEDKNYFNFENKFEKNHDVSFLLTSINYNINDSNEEYDYLSNLLKLSIIDFKEEKIFNKPQNFYDFMNAYLNFSEIKPKSFQQNYNKYLLKNKVEKLILKNNASFNYIFKKKELIKKGMKIFNKINKINNKKLLKSLDNLIKKI